jgi:RNA polymerase sigma factor (sigma-70 family)
MADQSVENLLQKLRSRDPHEAWSEFLEAYSVPIFHVVRHFDSNLDRASDCFQFVCEKLSEDRFRRLLRFKPQGTASFSTWLRAVVRNLCLDWRRKEFGRRRPFRSISRLSIFDQEVFGCVYERGISTAETLPLLQSKFPDVTSGRVAESRDRIEQALTTKQRWLLGIRSMRRAPGANTAGEEAEAAPLEIPDPRPDPEAEALLEERRGALDRALVRLSKQERLLVRLRFDQELTFEQIAKLLDLGNAQRADRQIKDILARLREELG